MAFFEAELAQPYKSLMYDYPAEDARLDTDAARRAREFSAQSAAARGSKSARGPALNTYNRLMSDYTLGKAATDRQNRLAYTQTMGGLMSRPGAVTPSTLSTLGTVGGTVGGALLKEAAPDLWRKAKEKVGWWESSPQQLTQQYEALGLGKIGGALGPEMSGELSAGGSGYGDLAAYGSLLGPAASAAEAIAPWDQWTAPALDYSFDAGKSIWDYAQPFNFDFGNVWGL